MRTSLRRLGCLIGLVAWLVAVLLPCLMIGLMVRGELVWERGPQDGDRLYLIQQAPDAGVGLTSTRAVPAEAGSVCTRTTNHLLMWKPAGRYDAFSTCTCSQIDASGGEVPLGECP